MKVGLRSFLVGLHNPLIHGTFVTLAWIRIYGELPSLKEFICIVFHDFGYITQNSIDGKDNRHPEFGARMCRALLGEDYYAFCITHSRTYANILHKPLSKLGYADKYSVLVYPNWFYRRLIYIGGEAQEYHRTTKTKKWGFPVQVELIKADYKKWFEEHVKK